MTDKTTPVVEQRHIDAAADAYERFHVEYDDSDDDFTICWPDGRYLVAHRSGAIVTGQSPQSLGVSPVKTTIEAFSASAKRDDGCPKGDPDCLGNNGDCHDACSTFAERGDAR